MGLGLNKTQNLLLLECVPNVDNFPIRWEDSFSFVYFKNSPTMISGIKRTSRENISDTETSCVGKMLITAERTSVIEQTSVVYKTSTSGRPSREREPSSLSQSP
ncbi:hypothetical protein POVCU1_051730 [Plasmodium ovale curtisi]|uniref:Uncharacterized protein n=1 Tax=Plasmodium ovale curtisi TaxID=864141 RepID=A0A1A8X521_PLAOA|nr:hypothetical protein POVCU1_051730 [Plasmodium ovale curtisi]